MRKFLGVILLIISVGIVIYVLYKNSQYNGLTRTFSSYTLLSSSWEKYKQRFINKDGRVIDMQQHNVTTSEGQSYALLRAVWIDDKDTFDLVWNWTKNTMRRPKDNLFGWRWGRREGGTYGFIENGGDNSASDADTDIAFALILATRRWHNDAYATDAQNILHDIWRYETAVVNGKRYLIAGNWANRPTAIVVNPSYFAPYAWRIFATVDKKDPWITLIAPAYDVLDVVGRQTFAEKHGVGLPPDWITIDKATGSLMPPTDPNLTTNNSFDAMRVPWRIALDYQWNKEQRAITYLKNQFTLYDTQYSQTKKLATTYAYDGTIIDPHESPVRYATALGYFIVANPSKSADVYQHKIIALYSNADNTFLDTLPYYEQNWLWFGAALYTRFLSSF